MQVKLFNTGIYDVNTYLVYDEDTKEAIIIDLGGEAPQILETIEKEGLNIKFILNTHGHFDHISGEDSFLQHKDVPVYVHKNDIELVNNLEKILMYMGAPICKPPRITDFIDENTNLCFGNNKIKIIETPGHTQGSVSFLIQNYLFSGDTLFYESVGRTDFPGGSYPMIQKSIREKLFALPDETKVYPGHGDFTQIGHEKRYNSFV